MSSQSLYTAAAGLKAQQQNIDIIANNISNVGTSGFRASRQDFSEAIYTAMVDPSLPADAQTANLQLGHGVIAGETRKIFTVGSLEQTGRDLDLALSGDGFYAVDAGNGTTLYTRDGVFESSYQNGRNYLVTTNGNFVLDTNGQRISSDKPLDNIDVDSNGKISINNSYVATLGVFNFSNPDGLEAVGSKNFTATAASGAATQTAGTVKQGFLENANVDMAEQLTDLISAQRAYSFLSRAISTADEMKAIENNLRR